MKQWRIYIIPLIGFAPACETNPIVPDLSTPSFAGVVYQQIDYNLFSVRHSITTRDMSNPITSVVVGQLRDSLFVVADSISVIYMPSGAAYTVDFEASVPTDAFSSFVTIRTRFYFDSESWTDVDTTVFTLRYPYPNTEFVLKTQGRYFAEDIDISDSVLYGQINDFILMYDMRTQTTSQSILIHSYECLTVVDNRYIIYDHANWPLYRFDLLTNTIELFVFHPPGRFLQGLEYYNGFIYELLQEQSGISLLKYSVSGALVDSTAIDHYLSRLTIHNDIAYFQRGGVHNANIERFDLTAKKFLDQYKPPSPDYEGIRIRHGYFYFSDFPKRTIARFPLEDLFTYGAN